MDIPAANIPGKEGIQALREGSHEAFAALYKYHSPRVYRYAFRFLRSEDNAREVVQEVFSKIWVIREKIEPELSFDAFLFTMTRNLIFNIHKKKQYETAYRHFLQHYLSLAHGQSEAKVIYEDLLQHARVIISNLPEQRGRVYRLSREEGLTHKQIALQMGISERTVEAHMRLALKQIRDGLSRIEDSLFGE